MEGDIEERIKNHEERIKKIEANMFGGPKLEIKDNTDYKGLGGGIELLIKHGFLDQLRSVEEIKIELHRLGYIYPRKSINKVIFVDLMKKKQKLTRIKDNSVWKYAKRK